MNSVLIKTAGAFFGAAIAAPALAHNDFAPHVHGADGTVFSSTALIAAGIAAIGYFAVLAVKKHSARRRGEVLSSNPAVTR